MKVRSIRVGRLGIILVIGSCTIKELETRSMEGRERENERETERGSGRVYRIKYDAFEGTI